MKLFKRSKEVKTYEVPVKVEMPVNYWTALNWLTCLSDDEFTKVVSNAKIYRQADKQAAKTLGVEREVTAFIHEPAAPTIDKTPIYRDGVKVDEVDGEPAEDFLPPHVDHPKPLGKGDSIINADDDELLAPLDESEVKNAS
jgi:hypothetical protein